MLLSRRREESCILTRSGMLGRTFSFSAPRAPSGGFLPSHHHAVRDIQRGGGGGATLLSAPMKPS